MSIKTLKQKIKKKKAVVGVVGLGYVGLPLSLTFARKGFHVIGIDISEKRVEKLKKGISYISDVSSSDIKRALLENKFEVTTHFGTVQKLDAVIICVPTPLRRKPKESSHHSLEREPDMSYIKKAVTKIKNNIRKGQIIVLESTTYPGTTQEILLPVLESSGLKEGKDFFLAFSPERIDPGNKVYKTENTPKIIGGISKSSTDIAKFLYDQVIKKVVPVSSAQAAEMVKLLENTFRIVNIALVNEIATLSEKFNLDIWEVIDAAKTKPYGYMPFYPGPSVGGHCIPVDPLYLSWKAKKYGFETKFINLASSVNESMPGYVVDRVEKVLLAKKKKIKGSNILVIGVAYKKNVKDLRESPSIGIINHLKTKKAKISYLDPYFPYFRIAGIDLTTIKCDKKTLKKFDCAILVTDHSNLKYKFLAKHLKLIFDTRNIFARKNIKGRNIIKL